MGISVNPDRKATRDDVRIMTLQAHILEQQAHYPQASGTFSWILSALSISAKIIADKVRRARLENVLGSVGTENVQGEVQQKVDSVRKESRKSVLMLIQRQDGLQWVPLSLTGDKDKQPG